MRPFAAWSIAVLLGSAACDVAQGREQAVAEPPEDTTAKPQPVARAIDDFRASYPIQRTWDPDAHDSTWYGSAFELADRERLPAVFGERGYRPPRGSLVLVVAVEPGVEQPRFHYYTVGDTAFAPAPKAFAPASTVKLMASVSALQTLQGHGVTGQARVEFDDIRGHYRGSVEALYTEAVLHSSNENYNRLVEIAGFDETNGTYLAPDQGFRHFTIQARYGKDKPVGLRRSPEIRFAEGETKGTIAPRKGVLVPDRCEFGNCVTIFELHDVLRRIVMDKELPDRQRFPIDSSDVARLKALLLEARNRLQPAVGNAFGGDVDVYNSVGRIPGRVLLENAYLREPSTGRRLFVGFSLPFPKGDDPRRRMQEIAFHVVAGMLPVSHRGPGLQDDAGVPMQVELRARVDTTALFVDGEGLDEIEVWSTNRSLGRVSANDSKAGGFVLDSPALSEARLLVIEGYAAGVPVAYRRIPIAL